jgi:hypothetical protein
MHSDHYLQQNYMLIFWCYKFETDRSIGTCPEVIYRFFCRKHDRFETTRTGTYQLLILLACGFLSLSDWVEICASMNDPVKDTNGTRISCTRFTSKPIHLHYLYLASANIRTASHRYGNSVDSNAENKALYINVIVGEVD